VKDAIIKLLLAIAELLRKPQEIPVIQPCGTIDIHTASSILLDKLDEMGDEAEIFLPDHEMKIYNKAEVMNSYELKGVSVIKYVLGVHDCDDFAAELFGKFAGLVWTMKHALNWFIDETGTFWYIEPQNKKLSQVLENWQGYDVRFYLGR